MYINISKDYLNIKNWSLFVLRIVYCVLR